MPQLTRAGVLHDDATLRVGRNRRDDVLNLSLVQTGMRGLPYEDAGEDNCVHSHQYTAEPYILQEFAFP
jgi:hypothetical protein